MAEKYSHAEFFTSMPLEFVRVIEGENLLISTQHLCCVRDGSKNPSLHICGDFSDCSDTLIPTESLPDEVVKEAGLRFDPELNSCAVKLNWGWVLCLTLKEELMDRIVPGYKCKWMTTQTDS